MIGAYDWAGGREAMLRFGPANGPVVIAAPPLFEEANRTRALMVAVLRRLAREGIGAVLPDLPGQGESLVPTSALRLTDVREAFAAAASHARATHAIAIRSGALIAGGAALPAWHLSPQPGEALARELGRMAPLDGPDGALIAGNRLSAELIASLARADVPSAARTVRLASDRAPADSYFDAAPPWRRAEPDCDPALAEVMAADIAHWVRG